MSWDSFWAGFAAFFAGPFGVAVHIVFIIVGAIIAAWILHRVIRHVVNRIVSGVKKQQRAEDTLALTVSPLAAVRVVQRTRTLGSVLGNIVNVTIVIIAIVLIVNRIDRDIIGSLGLLTAALGAGLGFGAQNIVKDVFNGMFMVMEDQLGVGDIVDLGAATGVVERVGIRITQVRDVNGILWFVRNGEILRVGNMSQGWARVIVDLAIPYDTDIDAVEGRMLATATDLAAEPKWRTRIIEKPEIWGLESISGEALVIRLVMKTRTSAKDDVARELRSRLKHAMDDLGVQLPSLNSIVLSGFDSAVSVTGARPPKTKPVDVPSPAAARQSKQKALKRSPGISTPTEQS